MLRILFLSIIFEKFLQFFSILFVATIILTFLSNYNADKIKKLNQIKSLTNIMQIDAMFDILVWMYRWDPQVKTIALICSIALPLTVIFNGLIPKFKNNLFFLFLVIISFTAFYTLNYASIKEDKSYYFFTIIGLQLLSIGVCAFKVLQFKRVLQTVNYLYYLLLGYLILNFFWYLGYREVIGNSAHNFLNYHYFFVIYLTVFRMIYVYYVVTCFKPFLLSKFQKTN